MRATGHQISSSCDTLSNMQLASLTKQEERRRVDFKQLDSRLRIRVCISLGRKRISERSRVHGITTATHAGGSRVVHHSDCLQETASLEATQGDHISSCSDDHRRISSRFGEHGRKPRCEENVLSLPSTDYENRWAWTAKSRVNLGTRVQGRSRRGESAIEGLEGSRGSRRESSEREWGFGFCVVIVSVRNA